PAPNTTESTSDTLIDGSAPEPDVSPEPKPEQNEQIQAYFINKSIYFDTIDQLIAFNKNPDLLRMGSADQTAQFLADHRAGNILSKDYIYIPVIADVSDYIKNASYALIAIKQSPSQIEFVYQSESAASELDQLYSEIRIGISWFTQDVTEMIEEQCGAKKDENGYILDSNKHYLHRQLEENCFLYVFAPHYPAILDFMTRFANVQKVNVNSTAINE
ncbi:MAG: hypothetical protein IJY66_06915, partial [Clostridia bacterium]|nr:hypothetical protein [Clostridia bacterium]